MSYKVISLYHNQFFYVQFIHLLHNKHNSVAGKGKEWHKWQTGLAGRGSEEKRGLACKEMHTSCGVNNVGSMYRVITN